MVHTLFFCEIAFDLFRILQIIFESEGFLDAEMNVAIDNVNVTSETCSLRPYFAEPGIE